MIFLASFIDIRKENSYSAVSPKEIADSLEVGVGGDDTVNDILDAVNSEFSKNLFDDLVCGQGDSLSVDLSISSLVDELFDEVTAGVSKNKANLLLVFDFYIYNI